jgi:hypothetical protein
MARYEGMDELLQRVRVRLGVPDRTPAKAEPETNMTGASHSARSYDRAREHALSLLHEAERLQSFLTGEEVRTMTRREQEEVHDLLEKVRGELLVCEATLHQVVHTDL